jgi:hypothetical protein
MSYKLRAATISELRGSLDRSIVELITFRFKPPHSNIAYTTLFLDPVKYTPLINAFRELRWQKIATKYETYLLAMDGWMFLLSGWRRPKDCEDWQNSTHRKRFMKLVDPYLEVVERVLIDMQPPEEVLREAIEEAGERKFWLRRYDFIGIEPDCKKLGLRTHRDKTSEHAAVLAGWAIDTGIEAMFVFSTEAIPQIEGVVPSSTLHVQVVDIPRIKRLVQT